MAELQRQASPGIVIALVGNKLDLTTSDPATDSSGAEAGGGNDGIPDAENGAEDSNAAGGGDARKVSTASAQAYAEEEGLLFFETSAKTGMNVQEVFTAIANAIPETSLIGARGPGAIGGGQTARRVGGVGGGDGDGRVSLTGGRGQAAKEGCAC